MKIHSLSSILRLLVALISISIITGCGGGETTTSEEPVIDLDRITQRNVSLNSSHQNLYNYVDDQGQKINFSGIRDTEGIPDILTGLDYTDKEGNKYVISYEENGLPGKITDNNGTVISLNYIFESSSRSLSRPFDPSEGTTRTIKSLAASVKFKSNEQTYKANANIQPENTIGVNLTNRVRTPKGNVKITVTNCGDLIDPEGTVQVLADHRDSPTLSEFYPAHRISKGRYVSLIPQRTSIIKSAEQMCTGVADAVSTMCNLYNPNISGAAAVQILSDPLQYTAICTSLATASILTAASVSGGATIPASPTALVAIDTACVALFTGGLAACNSVFAGDANPFVGQFNIPDIGRNNIAQQYLCPNVAGLLNPFGDPNAITPSQFNRKIRGVAYINGTEGTYSELKNIVLTDEQFPDLEINSNSASLNTFSTNPSAPKSGENYIARAELSCVNNKQLTVLLERDGMPLVTNTKIALSQTDSITLDVPGNPKGEKDIFNISAVDTIDITNTFRTIETINLKNENSKPEAENQSIITQQNENKDIALRATDADGDNLTYSVIKIPENGILTGSIPNPTYIPNTDYFGTDSFTFIANDGEEDSNIATVSIDVQPVAVNTKPKANNQSVITQQNENQNITLSATDEDGDNLTYTVVKMPVNGILSGSIPNLIYMPNADYSGTDSFTFKANDGEEDSNIATISIDVLPVVINANLSWKSATACNEADGDGNYTQKWSIEINQNGDNVTGNIYFHACPGGGRAHYSLSGSSSNGQNTYTLLGTKVSSRGPLANSAPQTQQFTLSENNSPTPNFAP